jgi:hypothetical protein
MGMRLQLMVPGSASSVRSHHSDRQGIHMYSTVRLTLVAACLALVPVAAFADTIKVGDRVRVLSTSGTLNGGAFSLDDLENGAGVDILTFCLQRTQHIDYTSTFVVGGINDYADDDGGPDYLSAETRWIYSSYRAGALGAYGADAIQAAIWKLENEWNTSYGNSQALISAAQAAVAGGATSANVKVLNLFYQNGTRAQDQLVLANVPEPASLALVGIGLLAFARSRRRKA